MLHVYVASHCRACVTTRALVNELRTMRPEIPIAMFDMDRADQVIPALVIGTPIYLWDGKILFMGNPDLAELLERVDTYWHSAKP